MSRLPLLSLALLLLVFSLRAEDAGVLELRTQKVGDATYFLVKLIAPDDLDLPAGDQKQITAHQLARYPRLLSPTAAHLDLGGPANWHRLRDTKALTFVGRVVGDKPPSAARLDYPTWPKKETPTARPRKSLEVKLDWSRSRSLNAPAKKRTSGTTPADDDLEGRWARAQGAGFGVASQQNPEDGFWPFALAVTGRKYQVDFGKHIAISNQRGEGLYELTTGATALTESLARRHLSGTSKIDSSPRTVDVTRIEGITIAEHPWKEMMGDKTPADEPLAKLVPHDNYYFTVHKLDTLVAAWELIELWGGSIMRPVELTSRDARLRQRYEKQLCLPSVELAKALKPETLRAAALTGNDIYWLEGSDVTALFHMKDTRALLDVQKTFIARARKEFGKALEEETFEYRKAKITSFVTPLREVSLYRATLGDVVVCSNSPVAIRRVVARHDKTLASLADMLDFQYMRTVFRRGIEDEDGFAFLPDAFIRNLVGPKSRIKAKRRLEARSAMNAISYAALYAGIESGAMPKSEKEARSAAGLDELALEIPEGEPVRWDAARGLASSATHGTLAFSTPLIELAIDRATKREQQEYQEFRLRYLDLWRQFFDPVGFRFQVAQKKVNLETYILPLVKNTQYDSLRRFVGTRSVRYDPSKVKGMAAFWTIPLSEEPARWLPGLGTSVAVYLDLEGLDLAPWIGYYMAEDRNEAERTLRKAIGQLPLTVAVAMEDRERFEAQLTASAKEMTKEAGDWTTKKYRGVALTTVAMKLDEDKIAIHQASLDDMCYLGLNEAALKRRLDAVLDGEGKRGGFAKAHTAFSLRPPTGKQGAPLRAFAEFHTQQKALAACGTWRALYDGGAITAQMSVAERESAAMRLLGFVPVSPDGTGFRREEGEVVNERHGSPMSPKLHPALAEGAPLAKLLDMLRGVRVDLRFREDGIHTLLELDLER